MIEQTGRTISQILLAYLADEILEQAPEPAFSELGTFSALSFRDGRAT